VELETVLQKLIERESKPQSAGQAEGAVACSPAPNAGFLGNLDR
jgi:hypothetical protein